MTPAAVEVEQIADNLAFARYGAVVHEFEGAHRIYVSREVAVDGVSAGWEQLGHFERSEIGEWSVEIVPEWKKRATCAAGI